MYCPHCGNENTSQAIFCANCGGDLGQRISTQTKPPEPQQVINLRYAGFWSRFGALIIDLIIVTIATILIPDTVIWWLWQFPLTYQMLDFVFDYTPFGILGMTPLIWFLLLKVYNVILTGLRGQTIGKMAFGIRVIGRDGQPPGIAIAALREVAGKIISTMVIFLGFMWVGWNTQKKGWHDYIASTTVIKVRR
jgi:uncharacterized RDD family membrane protein YckC